MSTPTRPTTSVRVPARRRTVTRRTPRRLPPPEVGAVADATSAYEPPPRSPESRPAAVSAGSAGRGQRVLIAGLLVALVAAAVAAGVSGYGWYSQQRLDAAQQQALATARQATVNFVSISAATIDRDLQRVTATATGDFKDEFTRDTQQLRATVIENKVDSHGSVLRAALVSGDMRSAVVLVTADSTVKNVNSPQGRLFHYRIQVDLAWDAKSGRWLVSRLQFVG